MKKLFHSGIYLGAVLCVVVGVTGLLLLRFLPPAAHSAWILPLAALLIGFLMLQRQHHLDHALSVSLVVMVAVWGVSQFVWPRTNGDNVEGATASSTVLAKIKVTFPDVARRSPFNQPRYLYAPEGTRIALYRSGLEGVRWITFSPRGDLFVSRPRAGEILRLVDDDGDGYAEQLLMVASGLDKPHGLFFANNDLLVAGETTLYRLLDAARLPLPEVKIVSNNLPDGGGHWTRSVVVDGQGRIYVSSGSSCNVCEEKDPRRGAVWRFAPGDGEGKLFASGLRNSVGLAFHPLSGELWGSDNGRDRLGDDLPPDEINLLRAGLDYGWPYCYGAKVPDPALGIPERCATSESPQVLLQAHSAPLGVTFGAGLVASEPLRNSLLVAFHGSWNRTQPTGYKLVSIPFSQDRPSGEVKDLVTGWLVDGNAWGRPVALAIGPQGDLFVTDDRAGAVYRIIFPDEKRSP